MWTAALLCFFLCVMLCVHVLHCMYMCLAIQAPIPASAPPAPSSIPSSRSPKSFAVSLPNGYEDSMTVDPDVTVCLISDATTGGIYSFDLTTGLRSGPLPTTVGSAPVPVSMKWTDGATVVACLFRMGTSVVRT